MSVSVGQCGVIRIISAQKCGKSDITRIVNGVDAQKLNWPWMVLITVTVDRGWREGRLRCGGTLINDQWILTAAHCVNNGYKIKSVDVVIGEHDTRVEEGQEVKAKVVKIIAHESYNKKTTENDIALLKIDTKLDFKGAHSYLQPICLPNPLIEPIPDSCVGTGWGDTSNHGQSAVILQEVKLPLIDNTTCKDVWKRKVFLDVMFCAGFTEGGQDTCQGDSGGPLQCQLPSGVWVQQGITSFGGDCAEVGKTGVYTRVTSFINWINKNTNNDIRRFLTG